MSKKDRRRAKPELPDEEPKKFFALPEELWQEMGPILTEVIAIFLLALAVFAFICNVFPLRTGIIGSVVMAVVGRHLFGVGAYVMPFFIGFSGYVLLSHKHYSKLYIRIPGVMIAFLSVIILASLRRVPDYSHMLWPFPTDGGGYMGYLLSFMGVKLIGHMGTYVIVCSGLLTSFLLMANTTMADMRVQINSELAARKAKLAQAEGEDEAREEGEAEGFSEPWYWAVLKRVFSVSDLGDSQSPISSQSLEVKRWTMGMADFGNVTENPDVKVLPQKTSHAAESLRSPFIADLDAVDQLETPEAAYEKKVYKSTPEDPFVVQAVKQDIKSMRESERKKPKYKDYRLPPLSMLQRPRKVQSDGKERLKDQTAKLEETLYNFKIDARVVSISCGPAVTRYEVEPGPGVRVAKISSLSNDIALSLAAQGVRIEAPVPGKSVVGIEIPNTNVEVVNLATLIQSTTFYENTGRLTACLGMGISGESILIDLAKMPHLLIAGATGSGKSVCVNTIICSLLMRMRPDEVKFLMIDPKMVELSNYNGIPHLLAPVVTEAKKAAATLKHWAIKEMERRYEEFAAIGVRNIEAYNGRIDEIKGDDNLRHSIGRIRLKDNFSDPAAEAFTQQLDSFVPEKLPYIVVIIDELADLMMVASTEVETTICRLAQLARATGIHLIIATQRPSVDVITGLIKANVPSRISFAVSSQIDSRTIIDTPGAEKLLGRGDMLYSPVGAMKPLRVQGVYINDQEIESIINHVKSQAEPEYLAEILTVEALAEKGKKSGDDGDATYADGQDPLFDEAKELVGATKYASTSFLQRKLRIGYNRAARLMDELEQKGVITNYEGENKARRVIS